MAKKDTKSVMGDFLPESTASSVIPVVKQNTPFVMTEKGKHVYVGMLLDVAEIGGISKKTVNDKDKGGVIELIKNGKIDAYITEELNEKNLLLFIPTANTISYLADYGIFRKASHYEFVKLNDKLEIIEHTDVFAGYDTFRAIQTGNENLSDYVKPTEVIKAGSSDDPTANHNIVTDTVDKLKGVAAAAAEKAAPVTDKLAPLTDKFKEGVEKVKEAAQDKFQSSQVMKDMQPAAAETAPTEPAPAPEAAPTENSASAQSEAASSENEETVETSGEDVVYTETQVLTSIERVFHADNLDIPLSTDPFDQLFTLSNHLIRFDIDSRDTYVNERLNLMAAAANRDLEKLRADNLRVLREKYIALMSSRIRDIQFQLDIDNGSTQYGAMKSEIDATRKKQLENIDALIAERQADLNSQYEQDLEDFCKAASQQARSKYKEMNETQHNEELNRVAQQVRADIDSAYNASMSNLYQQRRSDALTNLDVNITGVLHVISEDYKKMFEAENALYMERAREMREYAKELHQEDAKRLAIEEERNRITSEVNDARAEASAKIELIKKEYETAQASLEARTAATIETAEQKTVLVQEQMESRIRVLMSDRDTLQGQLDDAIKRADNAQETVRADYEHRLIQAQDDRDSWKQTLDAYKDQHKHNNRLAAILMVAITIAAIAGGFVAGGVYWNRIVANQLSGADGSSEIKIISPNVVNPTEETEPAVSETVSETAAVLPDDLFGSETEAAETEISAENE